MKPFATLALFTLAWSLSPMTAARSADDFSSSDFLVIVNAQNPIENLDRKVLADLFTKKLTHWPEDGVAQPVDLRQDSPVRRKFSEEILDRSVNAVKNYWQQLIFSGQDVPPPELRTDQEVIQYVARNPSSVGYVAPSSLSGDGERSGIKVVALK